MQAILAVLLGGLLNLLAPYELSFRVCGYTHGVPPWLLKGMAARASGFDPTIEGPTRDHGLMQIIESNAPGCGLTVSDLDDPHKNVCCGAWLMNRNLSRVRALGATGKDAYLLALARNNLGGGNVDAKIAAGAITWEAFKAATPQWSGKHLWVQRLWASAQEYRLGEWVMLGSVVGGLALLGSTLYALLRG